MFRRLVPILGEIKKINPLIVTSFVQSAQISRGRVAAATAALALARKLTWREFDLLRIRHDMCGSARRGHRYNFLSK